MWRVTELTRHIKRLLETESQLQNAWVRGELSNFKRHTSGHLYFSLKDEGASLACVMFRYRAGSLLFPPRNGMRVLCRGSVGVYERDGAYQLYVEEMHPDGVGSLWQAFEELKRKLAAEGLFASERKRPLPRLPARVAVITSPTGAAIRDIVTVAQRRFPGIALLLVPVLVQGEGATEQIAQALDLVNSRRLADVIIVGRGGGSMEELWAFNEEEVARAIARSRLPVVSAVGHESDITIADLVADVRAATPSQAAELVVPSLEQEKGNLRTWEARLCGALERRLRVARQRLHTLATRPCLSRPQDMLWQRRQRVDMLEGELWRAGRELLQARRLRLQTAAGKLAALNPQGVLARGYSICLRLPQRTVVRSADEVQPQERVAVIMRDGELGCLVESVDGGGME